LSIVVSAVNFIRGQVLKHRLLKNLFLKVLGQRVNKFLSYECTVKTTLDTFRRK